MKKFNKIIFLPIFLLIVSCESENDSQIITIQTGKSEYIYQSEVDVTITNNSTKDVNYFKCDNSDLSPSQILRYDNGKWTAEDFYVICTAMGPSGYFGIIDGLGSKQDTIPLDMRLGKMKYRYKFVIENDTLTIDSNEFNVYGYL